MVELKIIDSLHAFQTLNPHVELLQDPDMFHNFSMHFPERTPWAKINAFISNSRWLEYILDSFMKRTDNSLLYMEMYNDGPSCGFLYGSSQDVQICVVCCVDSVYTDPNIPYIYYTEENGRDTDLHPRSFFNLSLDSSVQQCSSISSFCSWAWVLQWQMSALKYQRNSSPVLKKRVWNDIHSSVIWANPATAATMESVDTAAVESIDRFANASVP